MSTIQLAAVQPISGNRRKTMALHASTAPVGFQSTIKPFFTACYRTHMLNVLDLDLWDPAACQTSWQDIRDSVDNKSMPRAGCPEGVWDDNTRALFLRDFDAWKAANFPP
jgi:hypothetical protein